MTDNENSTTRPARLKKGFWARTHYWFWSAIIIACWPIARLFRAMEKKKNRHE